MKKTSDYYCCYLSDYFMRGYFSYCNSSIRLCVILSHSKIFRQYQIGKLRNWPPEFMQLTCRSNRPKVFCKKGVLRNSAKFRGKHLCQSHFLIKLQASVWNFIKKETLGQVFSCEFCEISKNSFYYKTPLVAASVTYIKEKCNQQQGLEIVGFVI